MNKLITKILMIVVILFPFYCLVSCAGRDYMPDYFGFYSQDEDITTVAEAEEEPATEEETKITVYKLVVGDNGKQTEVPIPSGKILEISTGTFIAKDETDIGPKYTASSKFKIVNTSDKSIDLSIPPQIGPFFITSTSTLEQTLAPNQSLIINVTFNPMSDFVGIAGKVTEEINLAENTFELTGIALEPAGLPIINILDDSGNVSTANTTHITFDEVPTSTHPIKKFFTCDKISCAETERLTNCRPCIDMLGGSCELLTINKKGEPVDEVDSKCLPTTEDIAPIYEINLSSADISPNKVKKKIIEIVNNGPLPLVINSVQISDINSSHSTDQFTTNQGSMFVADSFDEIRKKILTAYDAGENSPSAEFPVILPPYDPPSTTTRFFIVVAYHPNDTKGSDGSTASVGSSTKDESILGIEYAGGKKDIFLAGATSVVEIPALQVFVKSSTGLRPISNSETLPFKGITVGTKDLALPLFMKLSDSAATALRISSINLTGDNFEWLDTAEKINAKPEDSRCVIPVLDENGSQIDIIDDLKPVSINPNGYPLAPGTATLDNMPLFGCINFTKQNDDELNVKTFKANIAITAQELNASGMPATNPDGGTKETTFGFSILGVIDPLKGKVVLRVTQTMAMILNPQFPTISASASDDEMNLLISQGLAKEHDKDLFIMAMHLDPFDEETIVNQDGTIASTPGDGVTAVFQPIDTRAVPVTYDDPTLPDYTSLIHDSLLPEGNQGVLEGYPNLPEGFRSPGLKIFTSTLSYPGPLAPPEERPNEPSECENIDPCTAEGLKKLGEGGNNPSFKGVCAFFHGTAGHYDSASFHYLTEEPPGTRREMCKDREKRYDLKPILGKYYLDGRMEFEDAALLFQGPTYFHTPYGPLGADAGPMEELLHVTFTTETILPKTDTKDVDRLPDKRIDIAKGEYRINLNDPYSDLPKLCDNNMKNRYLRGEYFSTWKYIAPLLKKDKEGTILAGCPEVDNSFTGGIAYLSGKRLDQETGHGTFVAAAKFSSAKNLTFAFKDTMFFIILNGWFCDPLGPEEEMEGSHCFDKTINFRDQLTQYSIIK